MGDTCQGGQFDGYTLTTPRDRQLCSQGGGTIVSGGGGSSGFGCGAASVRDFSRSSGRPVTTQSLYSARSLFGGSEEMVLLQRLSAALVPAVERSFRSNPELSHQLVNALVRVESCAERAVRGEGDEAAISKEDFKELAGLARQLAAIEEDVVLRELVDEVIHRTSSFVGVPIAELAKRLTPDIKVDDIPRGVANVEVTAPVHDAASDLLYRPRALAEIATLSPDINLFVVPMLANRAIEEKAHALGGLPGSAQGDTEPIPTVKGSYRRLYAGCTIYWSEATGAHEIHGEIRRKYDAINGPNRLGLPTTDESGTPDGRGRYNHFAKNASIYWTPTTGPFWVAGPVRFRWASLGWEQSQLGYPVSDQQAMSGLYPQDDVDIEWVKFENGMIASDHGNGQVALPASATKDQLANAFYKLVERNMQSQSFKIGFVTVTARPGLYGVDVLGIEPGAYGFWGVEPRILNLKIRGFVSLPVVSDPTWELELKVQFATSWPMQLFGAPSSKSLVARLLWYRTHVDGVFSETIASSISSGIQNTFSATPSGEMLLGEFPTGANQRGTGNLDVLDASLMQDGTLSVFVNPIPDLAGKFRQTIGQNKINQTLENL